MKFAARHGWRGGGRGVQRLPYGGPDGSGFCPRRGILPYAEEPARWCPRPVPEKNDLVIARQQHGERVTVSVSRCHHWNFGGGIQPRKRRMLEVNVCAPGLVDDDEFASRQHD